MVNTNKQHLIFLLYDIHFIGGVERVAVNMANTFVASGHRVTILSLSRKKNLNFFELDERVGIHYLNFHFENGFNLPQKIASVFSVYNYLRKIKGQTIVIGMGTSYQSSLLGMLPKKRNLKTVGFLHAPYTSVHHIWALLRWIFFPRLDAVVSLVQRDIPRLLRHNPNSQVIPNALPFYPEIPASLDNKIILSIGRMHPDKGYDLLIKVFEKFSPTHPDWRLQILGDGPLREKITRSFGQSPFKDRIDILMPSEKIHDHFLNASIYLMTSRVEALPMVLLEAQSCGLPIIAFDCETGPSDVITDCLHHSLDGLQIHPKGGSSDGFLVRSFDVDEMCSKLHELCTNSELRKSFGHHARENVRRFFPEAIYQKWDLLFDELKNKE